MCENGLEQLNLDEFTLKLDLNDDYVNIENNLCKTYCKFGFCNKSEKKICTKIHNTNLFLNIEIIKAKSKVINNGNKKAKQSSVDYEEIKKIKKKEQNLETIAERFNLESSNQAHTSGIDAFMTGYAFAYLVQKFSNFYGVFKTSQNDEMKLSDLNLNDWLNNVYLTGKYELIL
jgi:hypothetical protein